MLQNRFAALASTTSGSSEWWNDMKEGIKKAGKEVQSFQIPEEAEGSLVWRPHTGPDQGKEAATPQMMIKFS